MHTPLSEVSILPGTVQRHTDVTVRATLLGALCACALGLLIPYSDLKLQGTWIAACHLPIAVFVFQFAIILFLNTGLKLLMPRKAFKPGELITVYAMMLVASGIPSFGLTEYLFPTLAGMRYFASPENNWEATFFHMVPKWIAPTDELAIRTFFEGLHPGQSIPWSAWVGPIIAWTILALIIFWLMGCVTAIFRRQWIENEHLIFPLVQLPLDMVEHAESGAIPPFFRNRLMWLGASIPLVIHSLNGFHNYFPAMPEIKLSQGLNQYFTTMPWNQMGLLVIWIHFAIIGFSYLLSSELSFSLWFFFVIFNLESVALAALGLQVPPIPNYPTRPEAALQMLGAFFVLFGYMVYLVRGHTGEMLRAISAARRPKDSLELEREEPLSYATTVWGIVGGVIAFVAWVSMAGMSGWFAVASLFLFFVTSLVLTRLVSEGGLLFIQAPFRPTDIFQTFVGMRWMPRQSLVVSTFTEKVFMFDLRTFLMPSIMDSYKLAHEQKLNARKLMPALGLAIVLSIITSFISALVTCYHSGAITLSQWFCVISPQQPFQTLVSWLDAPKAASGISIVFVVIGMLITLGLSWARINFVWWPFHPLGYAMGPSWPLIQLWFSIFVGWAMKSIIMRYGSGMAYRRARPFFMGLVVGEFLVAGLWVIVSMLTATRGHRFFLN